MGMPKYQFLTKIPTPPQQRAQIFRLAPRRVNQETLFGLAQRFGLKGDLKTGSLYQDALQMTYREGSFELMLFHASGGLRFHDNARWQVDDGKANVTFDDAIAVKMAQRFIEELAVVPLEECKLLRVARLNVGVVERGTDVAEERVIDVGVAFQRMIDNVPVTGPGGKVIVYIDHNGHLTGVDRIWREIQDVYRPDVELQSPESAQQDVVRHWGEQGSGLIVIEDLRFGYFEMGWDEAQSYLQPAYFLPLTITATAGHFAGRPVMRAEHFVAAATKPPEPLIPAPPVVAAQAPRYEHSRK
jgi:hypothetical protein